MQKIKLLLPILCLAFCSCKSSVGDADSDKNDSSVGTTENDGVIIGTIDPSVAAKLSAAKGSKVSGSYVEIPAGALNVKTDVMIGEGKDDTAALLAALSESGKIGDQTNPLFVGSDNNHPADQPLNIAIPLPLDGLSLATTATSGKLVALYLVCTTKGFRAGIKVLGNSDFAGTFLKTHFAGFGLYIVAFFGEEVEEREISVDLPPQLKNKPYQVLGCAAS